MAGNVVDELEASSTKVPAIDMYTSTYSSLSSSDWTNYTDYGNTTDEPGVVIPPSPYELWQIILIGICFSIIILGTLLGNTLVCTAVIIVKKLRSPSNLLIVSLAVADLSVSLLVMPFAAVLELSGSWILGETMCVMWTSLDVLLCTSSILNLCVISIDRYFVITRPFQYAMKRTTPRMCGLIFAAWAVSGIISLPPLFGWRQKSEPGMCIVSQSIGYQFYATIGSFYLPLCVMIFIYYRIFRVSSRIAKKEAKSMPNVTHETTALNNLPVQNGSASRNGSTDRLSNKRRSLGKLFSKKTGHNKAEKGKDNNNKATKTLGVIMGAFTACWLPFFMLALVRPFFPHLIPHWLNSFLLWCGYCNSFLNPIIYARFNRDFRRPFVEIICCRCKGINNRLRSESFLDG